MTLLSVVAEIVRDLLIFVGAMAALLVVLLVVISQLPSNNPLKRLLVAISYRVGATLAAGAIAIPLEPIPGIDAVYDIGVPVVLLLYWLSLFRNAGSIMGEAPPPKSAQGTARKG